MKKIMKLILSLVLAFLLMPGQTAAAEPVQGGVTGISIDSSGILRWDAYPGADSYFVDLYCSETGDMPYFFTEETSLDLNYSLDHFTDDYGNAVSHGNYMIRIAAAKVADTQDNPDFTSYTELAYTFYDGTFLYGDPQESSPAVRISGGNRYSTSRAIADMVLEANMSYGSADCAVITTGANYPDALSGAFLANMNRAPILMISSGSSADVVDYVKQNIKAGGKLYVLGGTGAVPDEWLGDLKDTYEVKRLSGKGRYDTNVEILKEGSSFLGPSPLFLVCTGKKYADSLSCSSMNIPILLVGDSLTDSQREFLSGFDKATFYIIGGTGAVSTAVEEDLLNYGSVDLRISGKDRYETSALIAQDAFYYVSSVTLATGKNFPDGLSGGPLAYATMGPLLLVDEGHTSYAETFVANHPGIAEKYILGGTGAVSEETAARVFGN